jgi:hypothetical protein
MTSIEKGGFYAFPSEWLPQAAKLFQAHPNGGKVLDPCAGEGEALQTLAELGLTPYANELDHDRHKSCVRRFGPLQALQGDMFQLRCSSQSFALAWVNPPYTWDLGGDEKRRELAFLKQSLKWVQPGGYVAWVVYAQHLNDLAATTFAKYCDLAEVWAVPGLHLGEYKQIIVVARMKTSELGLDPIELLRQAENPHDLGSVREAKYLLPAPLSNKKFIFAPRILTPEIIQGVLENSPLNGQLQALMTPPPPKENLRPIVQPRGMQMGLVLAGGMFNGLILETETGRMAVRSTIRVTEELKSGPTDVDMSSEEVEKQVYRTRQEVTITLLSERGEVKPLKGDAALVEFIQQYKPALLNYLETHFRPLYNFDYSPITPILKNVKIGKRGLFPTQKHVVAAVWTALQSRKGVYLVGEPGTGKSIMGATVAAALHPQMKPGQVVICICPPHLVNKWQREVAKVSPNTYCPILETVEDVRQFMEKSAQLGDEFLKVGIISRERAKLGEGWEAAVWWRKRHLPYWEVGQTPPPQAEGKERVRTQEQAHCPVCAKEIEMTKGGKLASRAWLNEKPRWCSHCKSALWRDKRSFSAVKGGQKFPSKNPRMPLGEYIAGRYPGRVYLLLADELHEMKGLTSDQGNAFSVLANASEKVLGLTGTLYGGQASSLFSLEYQLNPRVRQNYPWGKNNADKSTQLARWVQQMGCLERVVQYKPKYDDAGRFSGKSRFLMQPQEAPGASPLLVTELLDHAVFVGLTDINTMPDYDEIPVPLKMATGTELAYQEAQQKLLGYLMQCKLSGDNSFLGRYLRTLLSYPSTPHKAEKVIHRKKLRDLEGQIHETEALIHTIPPTIAEEGLNPKEQWLVNLIRGELAVGRRVGAYLEQTGTRDIQPRLAKLIQEHVPGAKTFILYGNVEAKRREEVLNQQFAAGCNVFICNPKLVQTGLDLLSFPTLVFYELSYSLYVMMQASRRAWRIIQTEACRTYYPYYQGTMEERALQLLGRKQRAAKLIYGDSGQGLSDLNDDGDDLLSELAKSLEGDAQVVDLGALFQAAATQEQSSPLWDIEEDDTQEMAPVVIEPEEMTKPEVWATEVLYPVFPRLDKPAETRRRKKRSLDAAPQEGPNTLPQREGLDAPISRLMPMRNPSQPRLF